MSTFNMLARPLPPLSRAALLALVRSETASRLARSKRRAMLQPDAATELDAARRAMALAWGRHAVRLVWQGDDAKTWRRHEQPAPWRGLRPGDEAGEP